jgi:hypothetical protein
MSPEWQGLVWVAKQWVLFHIHALVFANIHVLSSRLGFGQDTEMPHA